MANIYLNIFSLVVIYVFKHKRITQFRYSFHNIIYRKLRNMRDILFYIKLFMSGIGKGFDDARVIFILRIVLAIYFVLRKVFIQILIYCL